MEFTQHPDSYLEIQSISFIRVSGWNDIQTFVIKRNKVLYFPGFYSSTSPTLANAEITSKNLTEHAQIH